MAKKQLTRTLDTSTAEGQEQALRLLQQVTQAKVLSPIIPIVETITEPIVEVVQPLVEKVIAPPQYKAPKQAATPKKVEPKRGRPAKGDPNEGGSVKLIADGSSVKRINMDFPLDLYERIESEIDDTGQTVKGFFLMLAKQYFKSRNSTPSV
jgi:hypothetical protein